MTSNSVCRGLKSLGDAGDGSFAFSPTSPRTSQPTQSLNPLTIEQL